MLKLDEKKIRKGKPIGLPYQKSYINSFDSQEFYDWAFEIAKTNIVIISSYSISDERFEAVYSFDKAHSTLQIGTRNNKCEKLFMVKDS